MCLDGQHLGVRGCIRSQGGHGVCGTRAAGQDRDGQARPGSDARREDHPGAGELRRLSRTGEGQKTAAFEICDALGDAPDVHALPVGNAGNITAYWRGYSEYFRDGLTTRRPRMLGVQAAGAAPLVHGAPVADPETIATAIRIGSPASWNGAVAAKEESDGAFRAATDDEILEAYRMVAKLEGIFVEPASAASIAGLLAARKEGWLDSGLRVVCTVTGNGLKDPDTALSGMPVVEPIPVDPVAVASALELA